MILVNNIENPANKIFTSLFNSTKIPDIRISDMINFVKPNLPTSEFVVILGYINTDYFGCEYYGKLDIYSKYRENPAGTVTKYETYIECGVSNERNTFPLLRSENCPTEVATFYYDKYNKVEEWHTRFNTHHLGTRHGGTDGNIDKLILSSEEAFVFLLTLQLHLLQSIHHGKRGQVRGAGGPYIDRDAYVYAIRKMLEWRYKDMMIS